jgi:hypothetical protein
MEGALLAGQRATTEVLEPGVCDRRAGRAAAGPVPLQRYVADSVGSSEYLPVFAHLRLQRLIGECTDQAASRSVF